MLEYDILIASSDYNKALEQLENAFGELYADSWREEKQPIYGKPFSMNLAAFVQMWVNGALKIFLATDNGKTVGFMVGMLFRPLPYEASVFQIEDWYARSEEAIKGLFDYAMQAIKFIGCDELWIADRADRTPPISDAWGEANHFTFRRYVRR